MNGPVAAAACTVVSRSHLAGAAVLAESLAAHHPGMRLHALVTDAERVAVPPVDGPLIIRRPRDLEVDPAEYRRMAALYTPFEFACALKPHIMRTLHREGAEVVLYLDGDMLVLGPVDDVFAAARTYGLALTAHLRTATPPTPAALALERTVLSAGWINGGLVATGPDGAPFLDWWAGRLARDCHVTRPGGTVDQAPLALAPGLFPHTLITDPGINAAWWTLAGDDRLPDGDVLTAGGSPVRILHLSGFDREAPHRFSAYDDDAIAASLADNVPLRAVCDAYGAALEATGDAELRRMPYGYSRLSSGVPYDGRMRTLFEEALTAHERHGDPPPPDPFGPDGGAAFLAWLREPVGVLSSVTPIGRYLRHVWATTPALRDEFPAPDESAEAFLHRCTTAARELAIPHELLPGASETVPPARVRGTLIVTPAAPEGLHMPLRSAVEQALETTGEPLLRAALDDRGAAGPSGTSVPDAAILTVDAPMLGAADAALGSAIRRRVPRVVLALWDGGAPPSALVAALGGVDEAWAPTPWAAAALTAAGCADVWELTAPVAPPHAGGIRARLGLEGIHLVHAAGAGTRTAAGDRPEVAVDAYVRAFPKNAGAALVVRLSGAGPRDREFLLHRAGWRDDVIVLTDPPPADADALLAESDCVVVTHPADPTGHTVARAMAAGALVIAPGISGDAAYLRPGVGIPLGPGDTAAHTEALAEHLKAVRDDPGRWATARVVAARALAAHRPEAVGPLLRARLAALAGRG